MCILWLHVWKKKLNSYTYIFICIFFFRPDYIYIYIHNTRPIFPPIFSCSAKANVFGLTHVGMDPASGHICIAAGSNLAFDSHAEIFLFLVGLQEAILHWILTQRPSFFWSVESVPCVHQFRSHQTIQGVGLA